MTYSATIRSNAANAGAGRFGNLAGVGRRGRSVIDTYGFDGRSIPADGVNFCRSFAVGCVNSSLTFAVGSVNFGQNAFAAFSNFDRSRPAVDANGGRSTLAGGASFGRNASVASANCGPISFAANGRFCLYRIRRGVLNALDHDLGRLRDLDPVPGL